MRCLLVGFFGFLAVERIGAFTGMIFFEVSVFDFELTKRVLIASCHRQVDRDGRR